MCAYQVLCEPKAQASQQTAKVIVGVADADERVWPVQVVPVLYCPSGHVSYTSSTYTMFDVPKFGRGSSSCAGREKRTAARSETPMNLRGAQSENVASRIQGPCRATYFRNMPKKVLNLELSSGGFSAVVPGVEALEPAVETVVEFVVEPGRTFSAARSAMMLAGCVL